MSICLKLSCVTRFSPSHSLEGSPPCYYSSPSRGVNHLANGSVRNESYKEGGEGERGEEEGQVERGVDEERRKGREEKLEGIKGRWRGTGRG